MQVVLAMNGLKHWVGNNAPTRAMLLGLLKNGGTTGKRTNESARTHLLCQARNSREPDESKVVYESIDGVDQVSLLSFPSSFCIYYRATASMIPSASMLQTKASHSAQTSLSKFYNLLLTRVPHTPRELSSDILFKTRGPGRFR